nr:hypothetical protein [Tanacetum cinerariifolium]
MLKTKKENKDNSFSDDSLELDTKEGEFVEVHSCNDGLPMGPNLDLPVHDHRNSEKAFGLDHGEALNPIYGPSIESVMPNSDIEPNGVRVNEVANGDCINELDNGLEELLASFQKLSGEDVALLNVYGLQSSAEKALLWNSIGTLFNFMDVTWIIFGDFNAVRYVDERARLRFNVTEANAFNNFIARLGLYDFPLGGHRFTRFDRSGFKLSKLDRFLVSSDFFDVWIDASVTFLCRSFLDHCPLKLSVGLPNSGPKAVKFFDKWIGDGELLSVISASWDSYSPRNSPDLRLKDKVKRLSRALVDWDIKAEAGLLNHFDIDKRGEWVMNLHALTNSTEMILNKNQGLITLSFPSL